MTRMRDGESLLYGERAARAQLQLPAELLEEARQRAVFETRTLSQLVTVALREYLAKRDAVARGTPPTHTASHSAPPVSAFAENEGSE